MDVLLKLLSENISGYGELPLFLQNFLPMLLACLCCIALVALSPIIAVYAKRKVAAHMQDRLGPMRVGGWHGWAQTIADGLKLFLKEDIIPAEADKFLFKLASLVVFAGGFASLVVLPFGASVIVSDLNIGVLYVVAISSPGVIGIIMAGWASNNKYALFGGTPFDIPEAESELVAGYHTEYSSMRFAFFMLSEYVNMFVVSAIAATLFLGGWNSPVLGGLVAFMLQATALLFVQFWLRWTLPRLRVDQLMYVSWKVLLPASFLLVIGSSAPERSQSALANVVFDGNGRHPGVDIRQLD